MNAKSEQILRQAADICGRLPLERAMDIELWLCEAAEFCNQSTPLSVEPTPSNEIQDIRVLFAREYDMKHWFLWFAMSSADWEGGKQFDKVPSGYETKETWIKIDDASIQTALNVPPIEGEICTLPNDS